MSEFIGKTAPRFVYRPSRQYTDEQLRRLRAAANESNAAWHLTSAKRDMRDTNDDPLPEIDSDGNDIVEPEEIEQETRKVQRQAAPRTARPKTVRRDENVITVQEYINRRGMPPIGKLGKPLLAGMVDARTGLEVED